MSTSIIQLDDVCTFKNGDRGKNYPSKNDFIEKGVPFINAGNIENYQVDTSSLNYISDEKYRMLSGGKISIGDIIFCLRGSLGKFAVISENMQGAIASSLVIIRPSTNLNISYLKYYLRSDLCKREIETFENGAAQPNLSARDLKKFKIPLPPLSTQKKIVDILDRAQRLIDLRKEQIKEMDTLVQALFYNMFGDPVVNPKGWEVRKLGDLCNKITDGTHQPPVWSENGYPFLFVSNIRDRKIDMNTSKYISESEYKRLTKNTSIEEGDVLFTVVGSYGHPAVVKENVLFAFQRHIGHLKPNRKLISSYYLESALITNHAKWQIDQKVTGIAQKTLTLGELRKILIPVPPIREQKNFEEKLSSIENQKSAMTASLVELENNFNGLMQRAFRGELV